MKAPTRLLVAILAALALFGAVPAGAMAGEDGGQGKGDNSATAINTEDGSSVFELAFAIRSVTGDVVDQTNTAVAYSRCESCQTVAIAFQIVLVMSDVTTVTPTNLAVAVNDQCTLCSTLALAYQFVVGNGSRVELSEEGRAEINAIRKELRGLEGQELTNEEIVLRVGALADRVRQVLATQLVAVRDDDDEEDDEDEDEERQQPTQGEDDDDDRAPPPGEDPGTTEEDPSTTAPEGQQPAPTQPQAPEGTTPPAPPPSSSTSTTSP